MQSIGRGRHGTVGSGSLPVGQSLNDLHETVLSGLKSYTLDSTGVSGPRLERSATARSTRFVPIWLLSMAGDESNSLSRLQEPRADLKDLNPSALDIA